MCGSDIFLAILAILFPPLAVWIKSGICSADSLINIALCCLGYFPGLIHAWYIISLHPEPDYDANYQRVPQDPERGSVTYYYVQQSPRQHPQRSHQGSQATGQADAGAGQREYDRRGQMGYGTLESGSAQQPPQAGGNEQGVPPSYQEAIQGDNKVQHD
ncbi:MAG: hypothetical protein M1821_000467 [Bathelium mastoideum]|nr:MAG: hypothetical protein M1821_000467 [Bathelium mastoideum]KAI9686282.1 MAG: hypothetical protein M1822_003938 [Bathelium mastoideum]